jgi:hypothetical protein
LGGKPQGRHTLLDKQHHRNVNVSSKPGDACRILPHMPEPQRQQRRGLHKAAPHDLPQHDQSLRFTLAFSIPRFTAAPAASSASAAATWLFWLAAHNGVEPSCSAKGKIATRSTVVSASATRPLAPHGTAWLAGTKSLANTVYDNLSSQCRQRPRGTDQRPAACLTLDTPFTSAPAANAARTLGTLPS